MAIPKILSDIREIRDESITATSATLSGNVLTLVLPTTVSKGSLVKFTAPCACTSVTSISIESKSYTVVDSLGTTVSGTSAGWAVGAQVAIVLDTDNSKAYIQSAALSSHSGDTTKHITANERSTWNNKQNKITGSAGQVVGFDSSGNLVAQEAPSSGLTEHINSTSPHPNAGYLKVSDEELADPVPINADTLGGYTVDHFSSKEYVDQYLQNLPTSSFLSVGLTPPNETGGLWIDTTEVTGGLKYYSNGAWVHVPVAYN